MGTMVLVPSQPKPAKTGRFAMFAAIGIIAAENETGAAAMKPATACP